jgi:hypothetical protein
MSKHAGSSGSQLAYTFTRSPDAADLAANSTQ